MTFEAEGSAAQSVSVTAENVNWDITGADSWIHPVKSGNTISVTVDDYDNEEQSCEGKFTVTSDVQSVSDITVTVTQNPKALTYTLKADPTSLEFDAADNDPKTITITAENVAWDIRIPDGTEYPWLALEKKEGTVQVSVDDNGLAEERVAKFLITSDREEAGDIEITVTQKAAERPGETVLLSGMVLHWGDMYEVGADYFDMSLLSMEIDETGAIGDGYMVRIPLLSEKPDQRNPEIAAGSYTINDTYEIFTAIVEDVIVSAFENGESTNTLKVVGGSFTIEKSEEGYKMLFDLELEDGSIFYARFEGELSVTSLVSGYLSSLTADFEIPEMSQGQLYFQSNFMGIGANIWIAQMWSDGISIGDDGYFHGSGYLLKMQFYSSVDGSSTIMPAGTYTVGSSQTPGMAYAGYEFFGTTGGCWILEIVDGAIMTAGSSYAPFAAGEIASSYSAGNYTFNIDTYCDAEFNITGKYVGPLEYISIDTPDPAPIRPHTGTTMPGKLKGKVSLTDKAMKPRGR